MPAVINLNKMKISVMAFEDEEDLVKTCFFLDHIYKSKGAWPRYYIVADPNSTEEDLATVKNFLADMTRMKVDVDTIQRNVNAKRFPELG